MRPAETRDRAGKPLRWALAVLVALLVGIVTLEAQAPIGAGTYYDDGAYLALARALAQGSGYVYSHLPEPVPGVKYPPVYPGVLAVAWRLMGSYPENLSALKGLNALFAGIAAGVTFCLFASGGRRRVIIAAAITLFTFLTVPTLSISTVLLSEPLFMLLAAATLMTTGRAFGTAGANDRPAAFALASGFLAGLAFLTRTIGLALAATVPLALLLRSKRREATLAAAAAAIPSLGWIGWSSAHAGEVPAVIAGQYGSYGSWFLPGGGSDLARLPGRLAQVVVANWGPFVQTLEFVWIPRSPALPAAFVVLLLGVASAYGLWRVAGRNPALALFPVAYLALVFVWPYEPWRFFYALMPLLTLAVLEGLMEAWPRISPDLPRWGVPVAIAAAATLVVNTVAYQARGHVNRSWESPQQIPASAYAPLNEWIRTHTRPGETVASGLDPYIHWETGRPAVPSWMFLADDYGRYDRTPEVLAAGLDSILVRFQPAYVALIPGENKAAATLEAFADLHPERAVKVFESEGATFPGVIYRVAPPGRSLRDSEDPGSTGPGEPNPASQR